MQTIITYSLNDTVIDAGRLKYVTKGSQDIINIKPTFSAAVTTEATLSLLKFCNPEIICKGHNYGAN